MRCVFLSSVSVVKKKHLRHLGIMIEMSDRNVLCEDRRLKRKLCPLSSGSIAPPPISCQAPNGEWI